METRRNDSKLVEDVIVSSNSQTLLQSLKAGQINAHRLINYISGTRGCRPLKVQFETKEDRKTFRNRPEQM